MPIKKLTRPVPARQLNANGDSARFEYTPAERVRLLAVVVTFIDQGAWAAAAVQLAMTSVFVYRGKAAEGSGNAWGSPGFPGSVDKIDSVGEMIAEGILGMNMGQSGGSPGVFPCNAIIDGANGESFTIDVPQGFDAAAGARPGVVVAYPIWEPIPSAETKAPAHQWRAV